MFERELSDGTVLWQESGDTKIHSKMYIKHQIYLIKSINLLVVKSQADFQFENEYCQSEIKKIELSKYIWCNKVIYNV